MSPAQCSQAPLKRSITVADSIAMRRLADAEYFTGGPGRNEVAHFSPDRERFVVVLQRGNLLRNVNEFTIYLFDFPAAHSTASPIPLVTMASSSNRDAITKVKWLSDNDTLTFIGENPGELPQVYSFNIKRRRLRKITHHHTPITDYDYCSRSHTIAFVADSDLMADGSPTRDHETGNAVVVTSESLIALLQPPNPALPWHPVQLYMQTPGKPAKLIPTPHGRVLIRDTTALAFSGDGHYALFTTWVEDIPKEWSQYDDRLLHLAAISKPRRGQPSYLKQYFLLNAESSTVSPLLNSPMLEPVPHRWASDDKSIFLRGVLLPLRTSGAVSPRTNRYDVEISAAEKCLRVLQPGQWASEEEVTAQISVRLVEDVNTPAKLYSSDTRTGQSTLLLDLNSQFDRLRFGIVEPIQWKATDGHTVLGGLYLPLNLQPGKRYPLVIQTHGFRPDQFSMDGRSEWSSAFAARPMVARGIVVLQAGGARDKDDYKYTNTGLEGPREMAAYEGAIDYLDQRGLIDTKRIGIVGFSRTVFEVGYTLTHSKYRFAAACLVDGIDGGYFQEIAFGPGDGASLNGAEPVGVGLTKWLQSSPGFHLDRMHTPVRLVALGPGGILEMWEWFAVLSRLSRPVELVYLPQAPHLIVKPKERFIAQQSLVDWFCFWLEVRSNEDGVMERKEYRRWQALRQKQAE